MSPAVGFFAALGAGVSGAAALLRPAEVRPAVWRLEGLVAAAGAVLAAGLGGWWVGGLAGWALGALAVTAVAAIGAVVFAGRAAPLLLAVGALSGVAACCAPGAVAGTPGLLATAAALSAVAVLGTAMAAMLLGHWYLVDHGMSLAPIRRLTVAYGVAGAARVVTLVAGVCAQPDLASRFTDAAVFLRGGGAGLLMVAAFGMVLPPILAVAAFGTLRVPNTQSATGILYVAVIAAFISDLAARGATL